MRERHFIMDYSLSASRRALVEKITKPVRVVLFTSDFGCPGCPAARALVQAIKSHSSSIYLEMYDVVMDRDKQEQYGIKRTPATVVQGADGQGVTFYGLLDDILLDLFLDTVRMASDVRKNFPDNVRRVIEHLSQDVRVQVFADNACTQCGQVVRSAIELGLESALIYTDLIVASDFPDLIRKHRISALPRTIFGENEHLDGHVSEGEFLEHIFTAQGLMPAPDRKCLVCGKGSADIICSTCKLKIQSEAVEHKRKGERVGHSEKP